MRVLEAIYQTHAGMVGVCYHPLTHWVREEWENADFTIIHDDFGNTTEVNEDQMLFSLTGYYY